MLTRCPQCTTTFRVTPEQLKARQGRVRCGECQAVFNALDTLVEEVPKVAPPEPEVVPPPEPVPEEVEFPGPDSVALSETPPAEEPVEEEQVAEEPVAETPPPEPPAAMPAANDPVIESPIVEEVPAAPVIEEVPTAEPEPAASIALSPEAIAEGLPAEEPEMPEHLPPAEPWILDPGHRSGPPPEKLVVPREEPAVAPAVTETQEAAGPAIAPAETAAPPELEPLLHELPPRRRWPWVLGILAGLAAFGLQFALYLRTEIATLYPNAKPALIALCGTLGCDLPLPSKVELVGIDTSDLHPDGTGKLQMTALLKNRAPFAQEYPHLELTLTDVADKALVRRVLAPADYLPPDTNQAAGFAAGGELPLNLTIEATGVPAAGYRLYLFYP